MLKKDVAICVRKVDYSDTSQIVTLFGREHGKFDAMAKGARRAKSSFGGAIEVFTYGTVVYSEGGDQKLSTLTEMSPEPRFAALRAKLGVLNAALFGAELIELFMTDFDPHPRLFDAFMDFLDHLQTISGDIAVLAALIQFQISILQETGSGLVLNHCVNCRREFKDWPVTFFSSSSHGILCRDCEASFADKFQVAPLAATVLAGKTPIEQAQLKTLQEIERLLIFHFTELLHKPPRMAKYFAVRSS